MNITPDRSRAFRGGQDTRSWPLLVPLLLVVLAAAGCVLWLLREAMQNERAAARDSMAQVCRVHLEFLRARVSSYWDERLSGMDHKDFPEVKFFTIIGYGLADSVICLDESGKPAYPTDSITSGFDAARGASIVISKAQALARSGSTHALAEFALDVDDDSRSVIPDLELLALETIADPKNPDFSKVEMSLCRLVEDYQYASMPAPKRRFIMHELLRLDPDFGLKFAHQPAEDLAAQFLDARAAIVSGTTLHLTEVLRLWSVESPKHTVLALYKSDTIRNLLNIITPDTPPPQQGLAFLMEAPGDLTSSDSLLCEIPAGAEFPGWRLAAVIGNVDLFDSAADRRVKLLVWVACTVLAGICALSVLIARAFGQQARVAQLKNDLVANVSHELKTPLTAMRALVETLLDTAHPDPRVTREYLQLIAAENTRLSRLIENFLTFSRLERNRFAFEFEPVLPSAIIAAAVAAFGERAHALGCSLIISDPAGLPPIRGDSGALTTALLNLLDNAWKYTGPEKQIHLSATAQNGSVTFAVADNGPGMSKAESRRVFERFYQSDQRLAREVGGCGLGLSIVQSIVAAHRGTVSVESEPGHGSTFAFTIPAAENTPAT